MLDNKGFDLWADGYDKSVQLSEESDSYPFAGYKAVLGTVYSRVRALDAKTVLDIGFGTGTLLKKLYDDGLTVTGVDFSAEMIRIAREKMPSARLLQFDFAKGLPPELAGEKFDAILCTYAIHHLTDGEKVGFIRLLKEHLNPGGEILLGDVAFETEAELAACRAASGDAWDEDEVYIVTEELAKAVPGLEFRKLSHCSGVCAIR